MGHWETSPERCSPRRRLPRGASSVRTGPYNFWRCIVRGASTWAIGSGVWSFSRRGVGSGWMGRAIPNACEPWSKHRRRGSRDARGLCASPGVADLAIPHVGEADTVSGLGGAFADARRRPQHFLAVSESTRQDLRRYTDVPAERIHAVTHGVDPAFQPMDRARCRAFVGKRFGLSRPFALYVGVIGRHKNIMGLLEAMAAATSKVPGLDLVLAGPFEPEIDRARAFVARCGLEDRVHFIGPVGQEDATLTRLHHVTVALVHPSRYEGWW